MSASFVRGWLILAMASRDVLLSGEILERTEAHCNVSQVNLIWTCQIFWMHVSGCSAFQFSNKVVHHVWSVNPPWNVLLVCIKRHFQRHVHMTGYWPIDIFYCGYAPLLFHEIIWGKEMASASLNIISSSLYHWSVNFWLFKIDVCDNFSAWGRNSARQARMSPVVMK